MDPVLVHQIAGGGVAVFAALLLAKELDKIGGDWPRYILPVALAAAGLFLVLDPIVFHGGDFGAEGVQHQVQGALMLVVAAVELGRARGRLEHRLWGAALPLGIIIVGLMFAIHSQHGGGDMMLQLVQHRITGTTLILTGVVQGIDNLKLARGKWAAIGWLLLLFAVCLQFLLYAEGTAPGVHQMGGHGH